jgi:beta-hydroxylase
MPALLAELVSVKFLILYAYLGCVLYVHFRGKERLRFTRQLGEHSGLFAPFNCLMYAFSAVPKDPILDVERFPQLKVLRENWRTIRDEALALEGKGLIDYGAKHDDMAFVAFRWRGWKRFHIKWYHDAFPSAVQYCPKTVALVNSIPGVNAAAFTMLPPGTQLGRHRDPFAVSLRYHHIWIDGNKRTWSEGGDFVFDETYIHWARNDTDENRIILFVDFTRPLHTPVMRALQAFTIKYIWGLTRSHNLPGEKKGALNHLTPIVFNLKSFFLALKNKNRRAYYAVKYALGAAAGYLLLVRPLLDRWVEAAP